MIRIPERALSRNIARESQRNKIAGKWRLGLLFARIRILGSGSDPVFVRSKFIPPLF